MIASQKSLRLIWTLSVEMPRTSSILIPNWWFEIVLSVFNYCCIFIVSSFKIVLSIIVEVIAIHVILQKLYFRQFFLLSFIVRTFLIQSILSWCGGVWLLRVVWSWGAKKASQFLAVWDQYLISTAWSLSEVGWAWWLFDWAIDGANEINGRIKHLSLEGTSDVKARALLDLQFHSAEENIWIWNINNSNIGSPKRDK